MRSSGGAGEGGWRPAAISKLAGGDSMKSAIPGWFRDGEAREMHGGEGKAQLLMADGLAEAMS